ncbi:uncharacterized protein LOC131240728 isoform X2 [Magnolia sinica]|nr:uncharacterized protein LOC131240728 isoform X2 [Magnolia sinica]XP_058095135.1 uncharacterized protein LOC131240728 isoform X2 [Magnolia sinica]XP_058095136.1 uncharacterized protein LOC131240728 isoform X2 [Magnolia sinica]XP_058095137.1 uncharacterized protein LOC131240728 isoform X2 [Magnolia sinica]XP_058095138.1 uncharacterized protein LOC131240728 isoform X2 [Magnolia sinica]
MAIELKLLIDKEKNRVVFAESDTFFVDALFSFLTVPIATVVRLSSKKSNLGSMDALYESIENLHSRYLQTEAVKEMLLCPRSASEAQTKDVALNVNAEVTTYYICENCRFNGADPLISTVKNVRCRCGGAMIVKIVFRKSKPVVDGSDEGVFVKRTMRFMISDDLQVGPISTNACLSLLNELGVRDRAALEEKSVNVGTNEALHILRQLMVSNTPLTDVFLPKPDALGNASGALKLYLEDIATDKKDTGKKMSVKLLVSESKNKVLYAEATNDFLDLLFSFLTFPLGSIVKLLGPGSSIRCLDNLYRSVEDLSRDDNCIISEECRAMLLDPKLSVHSGCDNQLLPVVDTGPMTIDTSLFRECQVTSIPRIVFLSPCSAFHFINPKLSGAATECGGGFVKGPNTMLMVTDGLDVKPLSFISGIPILDRFDVPISDVQERVVSVGEEEALSLLKAALFSRTVLSDVFCQKKVNHMEIKLERE